MSNIGTVATLRNGAGLGEYANPGAEQKITKIATLTPGAWILTAFIIFLAAGTLQTDAQFYLYGTGILGTWSTGSNGGDLTSKEVATTQIASYNSANRDINITLWCPETATISSCLIYGIRIA